MSRLDDLIKEKCPNGVKFVELQEVAKIVRGERVTKKDLISDGVYPVVSGGTSPLGRLNQKNRDKDTITVASYGTAGYVNWQEEDFWANDVCLCIYPKSELDNRFLYFYLKSQQQYLYSKTTKAIPDHIPTEVIKELRIPVPPLEVQNEIVRILDNFAELTAELTAELSNRKKQYEYYRDLLLDFGENEQRERVKWLTISDIVTTKNARVKIMRNNYLTTGAYPIIDQSQKYIAGYTNDGGAVLPNNKYVIFGDHTTCLKYFEGEFAQGADGIKILIAKDFVVPKYLYYVMGSYKNFSVSYARHWSKMASTKVPIPPLEEQERIVRVLDQFDKLATDIAEGLPAEIEAREKQYAYYRDKLLSFKELASNA